MARDTGTLLDLPSERPTKQIKGNVLAWYHPPDYRYRQTNISKLLQFVQGDRDVLYYRTFSTQGWPRLFFDTSGEVRREQREYAIFGERGWEFIIAEHLPRAVPEKHYVPAGVQPDEEEDEELEAAVRCRLSVGGSSISREFWVGQKQGPHTIEVGEKSYQIQYKPKVKDLGCQLKLERAEQPVDPGTQTAASYTSYVQLTDKELRYQGKTHVITMNQPLQHRGYTFYQLRYLFLGTYDSSGKPVSLSTIQVGYDLGLGFKYAGSIMLALGIACMFYMKGYFFKRQGKKPVSETTVPPSPQPSRSGRGEGEGAISTAIQPKSALKIRSCSRAAAANFAMEPRCRLGSRWPWYCLVQLLVFSTDLPGKPGSITCREQHHVAGLQLRSYGSLTVQRGGRYRKPFESAIEEMRLIHGRADLQKARDAVPVVLAWMLGDKAASDEVGF